jgi:hypothetical protein
MINLFNSFNRFTQLQIDAYIQQTERLKITKRSSLECKIDKFSTVRQPFPIWQITVPLGVVLIFATGSLTAYFMAEGRLLFDLYVSREQIKVRADVDKREGDLSRQKSLRSNDRDTETAR